MYVKGRGNAQESEQDLIEYIAEVDARYVPYFTLFDGMTDEIDDFEEWQDVLSASKYDDKIAWYENDGMENFTSHTITTNANSPGSVYAVDVDGDGDMDVLSASLGAYPSYTSEIAWYENIGSPPIPVVIDFTSNFIISDNCANSVDLIFGTAPAHFVCMYTL